MQSESPEDAHVPVLLDEVLTYLEVKPGQTIVDATVGRGGHSEKIAEALQGQGRLVAIDQDQVSLDLAQQRVGGVQVDWVHNNFSNLWSILRRLKVGEVDAVLADLGVSSPQLDVAERGFSFRKDGPLDMRMDQSGGATAAELVNRWAETDLARIFWQYGEERFSRQVARRIAEARKTKPFETTSQLAEVVRNAIPKRRGKKGGPSIDPATRVFQALRIAVNDELGSLDSILETLPSVLKPGGRAVLISFHSLEDRRVKTAFRQQHLWDVLTKKPVTATDEEKAGNPRSRSAKLRAAARV